MNVFFFDFQKVFDAVPHRRLMEKLKQLDLHPLIVAWLCRFPDPSFAFPSSPFPAH